MKQFLKSNNIFFKENVKLSELTGMYQDGTLPLIVYPSSFHQMCLLYEYIKSHKMSYDVLGGITNTYLASTYHRDVLIKTNRLNTIEYKIGTVDVACGCSLSKVSRDLSNKGYDGYDGFVGIPGTVGAAAINNSGAFSSSMSKVVNAVTILNGEGKISKLNNEQLLYSTRSSVLKGNLDGYVLLSVELDISRKESPEIIKSRIEKNLLYRKNVIDGKRKSLGTCFVASTMNNLYLKHKKRFFFKKIVRGIMLPVNASQRVNTYLDFLFLGHPELSKYCDSLNRFVWDKDTKEQDFFYYINTMQSLADNKLQLEIEIRK